MATPLTAAKLLAALKAEGCRTVGYRSWFNHNRDGATGRAFGPVNGVTIHHTAGTNSLALCYNGTASLPGPLCHSHLSKAGTVTMVGHGRANHAGSFARNAHNAVVAESSTHPRPDSSEPIDGNDHYYGLEIENLGNGRDPYPAVQYDQAVRWAAAICRAHDWSQHSVIGHKEGTRRKIDPTFDMNAFRAAVGERLAHSAGWNPGTTPQEDDMPITTDDVKKILTTDGIIDAPDPDAANEYWALASYIRNMYLAVRRTEDDVKGLSLLDLSPEQVTSLAAQVASHPDLAEAIAERVAVKLAARLAQ